MTKPIELIFFGRGPVSQPSLALLQQQSWCRLSKIITTNDFHNLPPAVIGVVVDFGFKLPDAVLQHFPLGIINVHPSLLPRWRGPSPIKTALLAGDTVTGVSIMRVDAGMDTGPLLGQVVVPLEPTETNLELEPRLAQRGAELLVELLPSYINGGLSPIAQSTEGVTLSKLIRREDGLITPELTPEELWNRYRAYQPWPGLFFIDQNKRYKITVAHFADGRFVVDQIQPEGKKPMALADFKRGYRQVLFADII